MRRAYIIDVCITCGAHAVFPFICGHRPERFDPMVEPWTVPITVEATTSSMCVLEAIHQQANSQVDASPGTGDAAGAGDGESSQ